MEPPAPGLPAQYGDSCPVCGLGARMVLEAERRLPIGVVEVMRCSGCTRALWYRSNAREEIAAMQAQIGLIRLMPAGAGLSAVPQRRAPRQPPEAAPLREAARRAISQVAWKQRTRLYGLRARRRKRGWRLVDLAQRSGVHISHISQLERGIGSPRAATITRLAEALLCTVEDLTEHTD